MHLLREANYLFSQLFNFPSPQAAQKLDNRFILPAGF